MKLYYDGIRKYFVWRGSYEERMLPRKAGFRWNAPGRYWYTASVFSAYHFYDCATDEVKVKLEKVRCSISASWAAHYGGSSSIPIPKEQAYLPFQVAGIINAGDSIRKGRKHVMLSDEQGTGKSIEAIGIANYLAKKKLLVVCPAYLRQNWASEIRKWHCYNPGITILLTGRQPLPERNTVVTSYELAKSVLGHEFDFVIVDEAHFLKSRKTKRTQLILGGIVDKASTVFLTGTPIQNHAIEFFPIFEKCVPEILGGLNYWDFLEKYHVIQKTVFGNKIIRAKNAKDLSIRLRGSGFMIRRLKKDVLKDLPLKSYKMVIFPITGGVREILKKEKDFNIEEIAAQGMTVGSMEALSFAETRRLMGLAKVPQGVKYIKDLLDWSVEKIVIFAHHIDVVEKLRLSLSDFNPVVITGRTPIKKRQSLVDEFQQNPNCRIFIGNSAAETGITLTAASDVVILEPDFVPGKNDQRTDRVHRIGQTRGVVVHQLVIEESMDLKIFEIAARKRAGIERVLN